MLAGVTQNVSPFSSVPVTALVLTPGIAPKPLLEQFCETVTFSIEGRVGLPTQSSQVNNMGI
jgi:hypothetical protein